MESVCLCRINNEIEVEYAMPCSEAEQDTKTFQQTRCDDVESFMRRVCVRSVSHPHDIHLSVPGFCLDENKLQ